MNTPTNQPEDSTEQRIINLAHSLGFAVAGIAPAVASTHEQTVRNWINAGKHGRMQYLADNLDVRLDPCKLLNGAKSIICVADYYCSSNTDQSEQSPPVQSTTPSGHIARYARGKDYHTTVKKRLHQLADQLKHDQPTHQFRCTVDTAPILEREHAARAGLGWIGKNTMLIHPNYGSWSVLGLIITTLPLQSSGQCNWPGKTIPDDTDCCEQCTRCIDACPTGCLSPYSLDATRCISYLTIEHRETINPQRHNQMGTWLAGCDTCQQVCPYNRPNDQQPTPIHHDYSAKLTKLNLLDVLNWTPETRKQQLTGSALKRIKLDMFKRNAIIAAGNYLRQKPDQQLINKIRLIATDDNEPTIVREKAQQILTDI